MADFSELVKISDERINSLSEKLKEISLKIWRNPEIGYEETFAHDLLTQTLREFDFDVQPSCTLDTAFQAVYETGNKGLTAGIICEYDALPEIGHACGHNLIAEAGLAAALGVQASLKYSPNEIGRVVVYGTPGEENKAGKEHMLRNGCFDKVDFIMMVHPSSYNAAFPTYIACIKVTVTYKGAAAHASGGPWKGVNALDAAVMAYNGISTMRQQMKPTWRIHGIITEGGTAVNVIPARTKMLICARAPDMAELGVLKERLTAVLNSAAIATGCKLDMEWDSALYKNLITNSVLASIYEENSTALGASCVSRLEQALKPGGSTDMGNVSHAKPAIHPRYFISDTVGHTTEFQQVSGTEEAQKWTMIAAKSMARTCLKVMCNPELMVDINKEFEQTK